MVVDVERYTESGEYPRWKLNTPIQIYIREDLPHLAGHTKDISLDGINIEVGVKLPLKALITLEIYFQRENVFDFIDQEPLKVKANVLWRRPVSDETYDVWDTGLTFIDITAAQKQTIRDELALMTTIDVI